MIHKQQFLSNLNSLKQKLNIRKLNTGRQVNYRGIVWDDVEGLHSLVGLNDCVHFRSGTEMSSVSYRGQIEDFGSCISTLDRCKSQEEQILYICRTIAYEDILQTHPFVEVSKSHQFLGKPICIDCTGMAQHYGLHTNYLDITTNFDVASFFATCKWDEDLKKYQPIGYTQKPGVMYRLYDFILQSMMIEGNSLEGFRYLGWQPLPRPEQQRANVIKLAKGQDFETITGVKKYYFKQSTSVSKKIYKMFDEGRTLFPDDSAEHLAQECKSLMEFTRGQVQRAFNRFEDWARKRLSEKYKKEIIKKLELKIVETTPLKWDKLLDTDSKVWEDKLFETMSKVKYRLMSY